MSDITQTRSGMRTGLPVINVLHYQLPPDVRDAIKTPLWNSVRLNIAFWSFNGFVILSAFKTNMSIAIVCIACHIQDNETESFANSSAVGCHHWNKIEQGIVLGSFYYGFIVTNVIGGYLSTRYGGKSVVGFSLLAASLLTLMIPGMVRSTFNVLIVLRVLTGLATGFTTPALQGILSYWAPPRETKLRSISYSGAQLGKLITFPVAAFLCDYGFDGGWASIFYIEGAIGVIWFVFWFYCVSNSPCEHSSISLKELTYLEASMKDTLNLSDENTEMAINTPWKSILSSSRVWAIILTHTCSNWGNYTFLLNLPTYIKDKYNISNTKNGVLSAIPYLFFWLVIIASSFLAEKTTRRFSVTFTRKLFNTIGMVFPAIILACVRFSTSKVVDIILITAAIGLTGFQYGGGLHLNAGDIAPAYTGVIFGISNSFATLPAIITPIYVGFLTPNKSTEEWNLVIYTSCVTYIIGAIIFLVMSTGNIQYWALSHENEHSSQNFIISDIRIQKVNLVASVRRIQSEPTRS